MHWLPGVKQNYNEKQVPNPMDRQFFYQLKSVLEFSKINLRFRYHQVWVTKRVYQRLPSRQGTGIMSL